MTAKVSKFFAALFEAFHVEVEDNTYDSEGKKNMLQKHLGERRTHINSVLPMISTAPEMVAFVFHGAFSNFDIPLMEGLVALETKSYPAWSSLSATMKIEPWAYPLETAVLAEGKIGNDLLVMAAVLEFMRLHELTGTSEETVAEDADDEAPIDLAEAGEEHLVSQGFAYRDGEFTNQRDA